MSVKRLNYNMYKAAEHLMEAGKYISYLDKDRAIELMMEADAILSVIQPEQEKLSQEKLDDVLSEILNFKLESV